jgi:uncharacterized cupin superfamily protein
VHPCNLYNLTGISISDARNPIQTYSQFGGLGWVYNKALAIPVHIGLPWRSIEYVMIPAGLNGVGEHIQTTDEIYYILSGTGELVTNGFPCTVHNGMLVIAPKGTRHTITNVSMTEPLSFLVVEIQAAENIQAHSPQVLNLLDDFCQSHSYPHPVWRGKSLVSPVVSTVDLYSYFAGAWGTFSLIELPDGSHVERYVEEEHDQLLFVVHGYASLFVTKSSDEELSIVARHNKHQSVLVPRGVPRRFANRASSMVYPLLVACLDVRRQPTQNQYQSQETPRT